MLKDTKSLGNNKAPACESRGFVHKQQEGVLFDTPSFFINRKAYQEAYSLGIMNEITSDCSFFELE